MIICILESKNNAKILILKVGSYHCASSRCFRDMTISMFTLKAVQVMEYNPRNGVIYYEIL